MKFFHAELLKIMYDFGHQEIVNVSRSNNFHLPRTYSIMLFARSKNPYLCFEDLDSSGGYIAGPRILGVLSLLSILPNVYSFSWNP